VCKSALVLFLSIRVSRGENRLFSDLLALGKGCGMLRLVLSQSKARQRSKAQERLSKRESKS
jgi:hypothetical protein